MAGKFASGEGKGFLIVLAAFVFVFALLLPLIAMIYVETKVTDKAKVVDLLKKSIAFVRTSVENTPDSELDAKVKTGGEADVYAGRIAPGTALELDGAGLAVSLAPGEQGGCHAEADARWQGQAGHQAGTRSRAAAAAPAGRDG